MMNPAEQDARLFQEFPPVSAEAWEAQIAADLKGADYEKKLIWKTQEGIKLKPYYRREDTEKIPYAGSLPGEAPFVRGTHVRSNSWEIRQDISFDDIPQANRIAVEAIERGAEGIGFNAKGISSREDLAGLIRFIELEKTAVHFIAAREFPFIAELFIQEMKLRTADRNKVRGSFGFDPWNYYLLHGDFYNSMDDNLDEASYLIGKIREELPGFRMINVSGDVFHNAGATAAQELAFALASGNEYLARLTAKGLSIDQVASGMQFTFSIGSNYFIEIAKIRAARLLWSAIVGAYQPADPVSGAMYIHGTTSWWNMSLYDPHVNILRGTTEAMSAAVAGCNSISVQPFDVTYKQPDDLSLRIARNTQIILKEESYFNKIVDPSAGSYYIESLTDAIAGAAWELFRSVEAEGGFIQAVASGRIRKSIEETAALRDQDIAGRSTVILGTNQYPNAAETMWDKLETAEWKEYPGLKLYRGAQGFEALRLATEKHVAAGNGRPKVFLLTIGNITMRKARAAFSANFFGCSGFEVIDNPGFATADEGVEAAAASGAGIVVICSADEEYATLGIEITQKLKALNNKIQVVIAGNPAEIADKLREAGADHFIHVRTHVLESLQQFVKLTGIAI